MVECIIYVTLQVLDSQTLDPSCNLSGAQQWLSSSCDSQMNNRSCPCSLFTSNMSLVYSICAPVNPPAFIISEMTSWWSHVWSIWEMPSLLPYHQCSCGAPPETSLCLFLGRWNGLFQNLNIKTAVYKARLNGCKEKPTCSLYIKPLQAFHAWCLQGIHEIRCKGMLGERINCLSYTG